MVAGGEAPAAPEWAGGGVPLREARKSVGRTLTILSEVNRVYASKPDDPH
jgi:hypothetical protein